MFYNKFIIFLCMFRALCADHQEIKIVLYSIWYHHTETSEWSKITKIQFYKYEQIVVKFMYEFYYYVLLSIELYFSNFRPLTRFSVMIPDAVYYNFYLMMMCT